MSNRRNTRQEKKFTDAEAAQTVDSFQNFIAHVGRGTGNQHDGAHYGFNPVTRNRMQMEMVYRGSWIAGRVVDAVAQDMTREGMDITSTDDPSKLAEFDKEIARLQLWKQLRDTIKWARLYGGAVAFMMIDGQDPATPLKLDRIRQGQFKGLMPLDRWVLTPSLTDLIDDFGPHFGKPRFYDTVTDMGGMPRMKIHYSRVIRIEGVELPYWQKIAENLWGQSVIERMWDRLLSYDSATSGIAQMVYKAHLRTLSVEGLREIIGGTKAAMRGLLSNIDMIRTMQSNEGLTLLDTRDKFETHQYAFAGLDVILAQFGEQLAGAVEIPLVRLFGQSPAGFSTGESDIRAYYDSIKQQQVASLGDGVETAYRLAYISKFGTEPPKEFTLDFKSLWQLSAPDKATVTNTTVAAIGEAFSAQIISKATALKELKALSQITGTFTNISDEDIENAESLPDPTPEALGLVLPKPVQGAVPGAAGKPKQLTGPQAKGKGKAAPRPPRGKEVGAAKGPKTAGGKKGQDEAFFAQFDLPSLDAAHGFDPGEKRDATGKWTLGNAVSTKAGRWTLHGKIFARTGQGENEKWSGGTPAEHARLKALHVPPAWTQVRLNPDPNGKAQVKGRDVKGNPQSLYSKAHSTGAAAEKFARLTQFNQVRGTLVTRAKADMHDAKLPIPMRDAAAVTYLISQTGFRIGGAEDTGAAVKAYGASTLEGRHVKLSGDAIHFNFTGKKGVAQKHLHSDAAIAKFLRERAAQPTERLFEVNDNQVRDYFKSVAGEDFTPKDMRTWMGTSMALKEVKKMPTPSTATEYKQAIKAVAITVSAKLGNAPAEALKSYIDPSVFHSWEGAAPKKSKVRDWLDRIFADSKSDDEEIDEHLGCITYSGEPSDWRAFDPGDDDDGGEDDEDIDAVIERLYGEWLDEPTP
jgi:phage-related protein (TIGR01555 family)